MVAKLKPLIVIVGETASGKSEISMKLAKKFNGEIIAADSWTVRQELNIGTSKPSSSDRSEVKHHLLDIVPPCTDFTAAIFKEKAINTMSDIHSRGKVPIIVGGTGLYVDSVLYDYSFLDDSTNSYDRRELTNKTLHELHDMARAKDLPLERIDTRNKRRVIRLIETNGDEPTKSSLRSNTLILGTNLQRDELTRRIKQRTDAMISAGLQHEVENLVAKYGWNCESLKGVGYIEWREFFAGNQSLEDTKERINQATQKLAKKQRTWFRRNKSIHWVQKQSEYVDLVTTFLSKQ